ncbi:four helix bundle protein [bacterium]|nr:four helix bundle protein [bacterium]MBU1985012.1 four helix bundle protein [bacterium]
MRLPKGEERDVALRTRKFASRIIRLYVSLPLTVESQVIGKQLLRAGTSVGAHIAEGNRAKSRADFANKVDGALQELDESVYWMNLLIDNGIVKTEKLHDLMDEAGQITAVLVTIANKTRRSETKQA